MCLVEKAGRAVRVDTELVSVVRKALADKSEDEKGWSVTRL